jgi:hypothetical protein
MYVLSAHSTAANRRLDGPCHLPLFRFPGLKQDAGWRSRAKDCPSRRTRLLVDGLVTYVVWSACCSYRLFLTIDMEKRKDIGGRRENGEKRSDDMEKGEESS